MLVIGLFAAARASACHAEGRGFKSRQPRHLHGKTNASCAEAFFGIHHSLDMPGACFPERADCYAASPPASPLALTPLT